MCCERCSSVRAAPAPAAEPGPWGGVGAALHGPALRSQVWESWGWRRRLQIALVRLLGFAFFFSFLFFFSWLSHLPSLSIFDELSQARLWRQDERKGDGRAARREGSGEAECLNPQHRAAPHSERCRSVWGGFLHTLQTPTPKPGQQQGTDINCAEGREKGKASTGAGEGFGGRQHGVSGGAKAPSWSRDASRAAPRGFVPFCSVSFTVLEAHLAAVPWIQA